LPTTFLMQGSLLQTNPMSKSLLLLLLPLLIIALLDAAPITSQDIEWQQEHRQRPQVDAGLDDWAQVNTHPTIEHMNNNINRRHRQVHEFKVRAPAGPHRSLWLYPLDFVQGAGRSVVDVFGGWGTAVIHPIQSVGNLAGLVVHPYNSAKGWYKMKKQKWDKQPACLVG
jgi:hypothetical protein